MVCGLPTGVTASFSANPALSMADPSASGATSARSTLTLATTRFASSDSFALAVYAFFKDAFGDPVDIPPGGGGVTPPGVILTVSPYGPTTLTPDNTIPPVGFANCSTAPPGYTTLQTATPVPANVTVFSYVSDTHPQAGEQVSVFAGIEVAGQAQANVPFQATWYLPFGTQGCSGVTDQTGIGSCLLYISHVQPGTIVTIQVTFAYNGLQYQSTTSFME